MEMELLLPAGRQPGGAARGEAAWGGRLWEGSLGGQPGEPCRGGGGPDSGDASSRLHRDGDERILISLEPLWSPRALHALIGKCLRSN